MTTNAGEKRPGATILGSHIDAMSWEQVLGSISRWAAGGESRYVCVCTAHSLVTGKHDPTFQSIINGADMSTPDGMPIVWLLRAKGFSGQERIYGPDLMWKYCERAGRSERAVYLYGSTESVLEKLQERLRQAFPDLRIAGAFSPPFEEMSPEDDSRIVDEINGSGAGVVFVGLGCPKQERWMAAHRGRIKATMIGVGAAFDFHAGTIRQAPAWLRRIGLEWLYRLLTEPRRLWRRYAYTNPLFVYHVTRDLLRKSQHGGRG